MGGGASVSTPGHTEEHHLQPFYRRALNDITTNVKMSFFFYYRLFGSRWPPVPSSCYARALLYVQ